MKEFCGETLQLSIGFSVGSLEQLYRKLSFNARGKRAFWVDNDKNCYLQVDSDIAHEKMRPIAKY